MTLLESTETDIDDEIQVHDLMPDVINPEINNEISNAAKELAKPEISKADYIPTTDSDFTAVSNLETLLGSRVEEGRKEDFLNELEAQKRNKTPKEYKNFLYNLVLKGLDTRSISQVNAERLSPLNQGLSGIRILDNFIKQKEKELSKAS